MVTEPARSETQQAKLEIDQQESFSSTKPARVIDRSRDSSNQETYKDVGMWGYVMAPMEPCFFLAP